MKILHVLSGYEEGGTATYVIELFQECSRQGLRMDAVTLTPSGLSERLKNSGMTVHILRKRGVFDPSMPFRIARIARDHKYSVLHSHSLGSNLYTRLAAMIIRSCKVVTSVHSDYHLMRTNSQHRIKTSITLLIDVTMRRRTDAFIAVSEELFHKMKRRHFPLNKIFLVLNGIFIDRDGPLDENKDGALRKVREDLKLSEHDHPLFVNTQRFNNIKNHMLIFRAVKLLSLSIPSIKFILVGTGFKDRDIRNMVEELGIGDHVILAGWVDDCSPYLKIADIFVTASRYETISYSILEAMKYNMPVIGARVGGIPETIEDGYNGFLFEDNNVDDLAKVMKLAVEDPSRSRKMGTNSRAKLVSEFNVSEMARQTIEIYSNLLNPVRNDLHA